MSSEIFAAIYFLPMFLQSLSKRPILKYRTISLVLLTFINEKAYDAEVCRPVCRRAEIKIHQIITVPKLIRFLFYGRRSGHIEEI